MTQEWIIDQINKSLDQYTGSNEGILDAAYWIEREHKESLREKDIEIESLVKRLQDLDQENEELKMESQELSGLYETALFKLGRKQDKVADLLDENHDLKQKIKGLEEQISH